MRTVRGVEPPGKEALPMEKFIFIFNSLALGAGLAMDAFSVSLANGLAEPHMKTRKMAGIAGIFAGFQAAMPLLGWLMIHTVAEFFSFVETLVPWAALVLLSFIGGKMLWDGIRHRSAAEPVLQVAGFRTLLVQGIATSIDALSVGVTMAGYQPLQALFAALIIALVTFLLCFSGVFLGKKFGTRLAGKAEIFGGVILIAIGIEIFITGIV